MSRWISFIVLAAIVVLFGFLFYQVMSQFLLPLFMAVVLVIIFRPMHRWYTVILKGRERIAAVLTTLTILLIVLGPILLILSLATAEGVSLAARLSRPETLHDIEAYRNQLGLDLPSKDTVLIRDQIKASLEKLNGAVLLVQTDDSNYPDQVRRLRILLKTVENQMGQLAAALEKDRQRDVAKGVWREGDVWVKQRTESLVTLDKLRSEVRALEKQIEMSASANHAGEIPRGPPSTPRTSEPTLPVEALAVDASQPVQDPSTDESAKVPLGARDLPSTQLIQDSSMGDSPVPLPEADPPASGENPLPSAAELPAEPVLESSKIHVEELTTPVTLDPEHLTKLAKLAEDYAGFERQLMGPPWMYGLKVLANPDESVVKSLVEGIQGWFAPVAREAFGVLAKLVVGLIVMAIALYYFLADGNEMVATIMRLSPLDDRHEQALLAQFEKISRAVVSATIATAVVQGLLGGVGYWVSGIQQVFLLTLVTMVTSMIPFVGAAVVWISCSIYLAISGHHYQAIGLAIYGFTVISMVDNLIKPYILHGQSNLHPLLALLSVLGGVQALGLIGIFVGPMAVAFLQALLNILHNELAILGAPAAAVSSGDVVIPLDVVAPPSPGGDGDTAPASSR